ncbi:hypothetical protein WEI85_48265 [Actinomycetes bacterium KLBMP 9797]
MPGPHGQHTPLGEHDRPLGQVRLPDWPPQQRQIQLGSAQGRERVAEMDLA